jgi:hypothetical protein
MIAESIFMIDQTSCFVIMIIRRGGKSKKNKRTGSGTGFFVLSPFFFRTGMIE